MGVFMTGINHLKRLSRAIVLFYPFSFVLWVFTLPASLGRFRTELIPDYTLWSRLLPCNHNISSLVLFLAPVAYPGLSTPVVFQLCVLVFLEFVADAGKLHQHVFELLEPAALLPLPCLLIHNLYKSEHETISHAYCVVFVSCAE